MVAVNKIDIAAKEPPLSPHVSNCGDDHSNTDRVHGDTGRVCAQEGGSAVGGGHMEGLANKKNDRRSKHSAAKSLSELRALWTERLPRAGTPKWMVICIRDNLCQSWCSSYARRFHLWVQIMTLILALCSLLCVFLLFLDLVEISALQGRGTTLLLHSILAHIPHGPLYYPKDTLTTRNERFFTAEIIRECILKLYKVPMRVHLHVCHTSCDVRNVPTLMYV